MGFGAPANDELADTITVGQYLIRDKDASYLLEVASDKLQDSGILAGDLVIFERSGNYRPGDIVVVLNEDGYELQYLKQGVPLRGIIGVVTGSFRSYHQ
jgi:DNA polymerase V